MKCLFNSQYSSAATSGGQWHCYAARFFRDKAGGVRALTLTQCTFVADPHKRALHGIGKMHYARRDLQHRQKAERLFWAMNAWRICGFVEDDSMYVNKRKSVHINRCQGIAKFWGEGVFFLSLFIFFLQVLFCTAKIKSGQLWAPSQRCSFMKDELRHRKTSKTATGNVSCVAISGRAKASTWHLCVIPQEWHHRKTFRLHKLDYGVDSEASIGNRVKQEVKRITASQYTLQL